MHRLFYFLSVTVFSVSIASGCDSFEEGCVYPVTKRSFVERAPEASWGRTLAKPLDWAHGMCVRLIKSPFLIFMGLASWASAWPQVSAELESDQFWCSGHFKTPVSRDDSFLSDYGADAELLVLCEDLFGETRCKQSVSWFEEGEQLQECISAEVRYNEAVVHEAMDVCRCRDCAEAFLSLGTSSRIACLDCSVEGEAC